MEQPFMQHFALSLFENFHGVSNCSVFISLTFFVIKDDKSRYKCSFVLCSSFPFLLSVQSLQHLGKVISFNRKPTFQCSQQLSHQAWIGFISILL